MFQIIIKVRIYCRYTRPFYMEIEDSKYCQFIPSAILNIDKMRFYLQMFKCLKMIENIQLHYSSRRFYYAPRRAARLYAEYLKTMNTVFSTKASSYLIILILLSQSYSDSHSKNQINLFFWMNVVKWFFKAHTQTFVPSNKSFNVQPFIIAIIFY